MLELKSSHKGVILEDWNKQWREARLNYTLGQQRVSSAIAWMTICALIGAIGLLTEQNYGPFFSILAASSMIFVALMDITFNVENKMYRHISTFNEMKLELAANIWFLSVGIILIIYLWTRIVTY